MITRDPHGPYRSGLSRCDLLVTLPWQCCVIHVRAGYILGRISNRLRSNEESGGGGGGGGGPPEFIFKIQPKYDTRHTNS